MRASSLLTAVLFCVVSTALSQSDEPARERSSNLISAYESGMPFSLVFDGKPSKEFLPSWQKSETVHPLPGGRTLRTITYRDPVTHLEVSREITTLPGEHAVEWLLRLRNSGTKDSAVLENILPLDVGIPVPAAGAVTFHHVHGSSLAPPDYIPVDQDLSPGETVQLAHYILNHGFHRDGYMPFFNLQWADGGLVGAIGWSGQWMVSAGRSGGKVTIKSGQELTHLRLHAGESIRTPRILLVQWSGTDRFAGQNALRRLSSSITQRGFKVSW
jgi:alpha-galactosidase